MLSFESPNNMWDAVYASTTQYLRRRASTFLRYCVPILFGDNGWMPFFLQVANKKLGLLLIKIVCNLTDNAVDGIHVELGTIFRAVNSGGDDRVLLEMR